MYFLQIKRPGKSICNKSKCNMSIFTMNGRVIRKLIIGVEKNRPGLYLELWRFTSVLKMKSDQDFTWATFHAIGKSNYINWENFTGKFRMHSKRCSFNYSCYTNKISIFNTLMIGMWLVFGLWAFRHLMITYIENVKEPWRARSGF